MGESRMERDNTCQWGDMQPLEQFGNVVQKLTHFSRHRRRTRWYARQPTTAEVGIVIRVTAGLGLVRFTLASQALLTNILRIPSRIPNTFRVAKSLQYPGVRCLCATLGRCVAVSQLVFRLTDRPTVCVSRIGCWELHVIDDVWRFVFCPEGRETLSILEFGSLWGTGGPTARLLQEK